MILGISLNSRIISFAVLKNLSLYEHDIKLFKERWSVEKMKRMIDCICQYMSDHAIESVSLLIPQHHHSNPETRLLIRKIKEYCKKRQVDICCYAAHELHTLHECTRQKKKALMQALSSLYPELSLAQKKELSNKKRYYFKLFEAVGATALYAQSHLY